MMPRNDGRPPLRADKGPRSPPDPAARTREGHCHQIWRLEAEGRWRHHRIWPSTLSVKGGEAGGDAAPPLDLHRGGMLTLDLGRDATTVGSRGRSDAVVEARGHGGGERTVPGCVGERRGRGAVGDILSNRMPPH